MFAGTVLHDIAKPACTRTEDDGRIRSPGHAVRGVSVSRRILAFDPTFGPEGTPFAEREQVLALVRWHGLPGNFLDKPDPLRAVILAAVTARTDLLAVLAEADHRGRDCRAPTDDTFTRLGLFPDFCREAECWGVPRAFSSDHARVHYYRDPGAHPTLHLFDDTRCEVTILSGLPGSGKDTWVKAHADGRAVVSLDALREELDVDTGDNQGPVVAAAHERARELLRRGEPFVWNATNITRVMREKVIGLAAAYNARVRVVYLEPPPALTRARNAARARAVPLRVWDRLFDKLDVPTAAEAHTIEVPANGAT